MAKTEIRGAQIKDTDVTSSDLASGAVTLAKMANMATASFLGRNTAGTGVPEVLSAATARTILNAIAFGDYVFNTSNFVYHKRLLMPEKYNLFFRADSRYTVSQTGFAAYGTSDLWTGNYENTNCRIALSGTGVITINLIGKSEYTANGIIYPGGKIYIHCYKSGTSYMPPTNVSGRMQVRTADGSGWTALTSPTYDSTSGLWVLTVPDTPNYIVTIELTIVATTTTGATYVTAIDYHASRGYGNLYPYPMKYQAEKLYSSWSWMDSSNVDAAKIDPSSTTRAIFGSAGISNKAALKVIVTDGAKPTVQLASYGNQADVLLLNNEGKVGIGVTNPSVKVAIAPDTDDNAFYVLKADESNVVFAVNTAASTVSVFGDLSVSGKVSEAGNDGWSPGETWTRASATTFTVSGDVTSKYTKGCKIKLTDTTVKYFYVVDATYSAPNTTVTVTGGSDYSLVGTITSPYFSRYASPANFPEWFNWSPTITGYSANPTNVSYRFRIDGKTCFVKLREVTNGTSNSTWMRYTLPVTAGTVTNAVWLFPLSYVDNGVSSTTYGRGVISSAGTEIIFGINPATPDGFTASGGKRISSFDGWYEI